MKKLTVLALALALAATGLAGCGKPGASGQKEEAAGGGESPGNPYKDHMNISLAIWDVENALSDKKNDAVYQYIAKKFNVDFVPVNTTWDDYTQKIQVWAASGSLPDIFAIDAIGTQSYINWTKEGIVRPLPKLDPARWPNLAKYFETPDIKALADKEGNYFCVPRRMYPTVDWSALDRVVAYRWDLAQKAGVTKEPETWDEFEDMLAKIVKADPMKNNVAGLTATTTKLIGGLFWLYSDPVATSDGSGSDFKWIKEDGKFIPAVFSKNALPSLENMRKMYDQGIIDPDLALTNVNTAYDKFVEGKVAALLMAGGYKNLDGAIYAQRWSKAHPDVEFTDAVKVLKPMKDINGEYAHAIFKTYWSESYFNANVDEKKMDRIMDIYNFLLSDEGVRLTNYGFEGVDYEMKDGKVVMKDPKVNLDQKYKSKSVFSQLVAYNNDIAYTMDSNVIVNPKIRKEGVDYIQWVLKNTKVPKYYPKLTYVNTPAKDGFSILDHDDLLQIMMGKEPVADMWKATIANYEKKGLGKMIDQVNQEAAKMGLK